MITCDQLTNGQFYWKTFCEKKKHHKLNLQYTNAFLILLFSLFYAQFEKIYFLRYYYPRAASELQGHEIVIRLSIGRLASSAKLPFYTTGDLPPAASVIWWKEPLSYWRVCLSARSTVFVFSNARDIFRAFFSHQNVQFPNN